MLLGLDASGYGGGPPGTASIATLAGEIVSLAFLLVSLIVLAFLSYRVKTVKSFQFEMFIFALVVVIAEVPKILGTLGYIQTSGIQGLGLLLHTASMIFLSGFIMIRVLKYFTQGK